MTFEEFQDSKEYKSKWVEPCEEQEIGPCFIYGETGSKTYWVKIYNDDYKSYTGEKGKYYTLISNEEYLTDDLLKLERLLYEAFFLESEMNPSLSIRSSQIVEKWVGILGGGLHPDTRAKDYNPPLSPDLQKEYEADMDTLFSLAGDPYDLIVKEMERQNKV